MLPSRECIPYSSPLLMIDPDFKQVTLADDTITINGGFAPAERTIHMKLSTHDEAEPSLQGHSIGHWEGDTLVIDTRNFSDHRIGNGYRGIASGKQKHLVERLRLQQGGTRLEYSFELTDPEFLAAPVASRQPQFAMPQAASLHSANAYKSAIAACYVRGVHYSRPNCAGRPNACNSQDIDVFRRAMCTRS